MDKKETTRDPYQHLSNQSLMRLLAEAEAECEDSALRFFSLITPQEMHMAQEQQLILPQIDIVLDKIPMIIRLENECQRRGLLEDFRKHRHYLDPKTLDALWYSHYQERLLHLMSLKAQGYLEPDFVKDRIREYHKKRQESNKEPALMN